MAFALVVFSSWSALSSDLCLADSFPLCQSQLTFKLLRETYFDQQPHSYCLFITLFNHLNIIDQRLKLPCSFICLFVYGYYVYFDFYFQVVSPFNYCVLYFIVNIEVYTCIYAVFQIVFQNIKNIFIRHFLTLEVV